MKMSAIIATVFAVGLTAAVPQSPTDAQIASIVVTANQVDVDAGKVAQAVTTNAEVKAFATSMVTGHRAINEQAVALVTRIEVTPEDNPTSRSLKAAGEKNVARLEKLKGAAFDKAYIDHEVAYHQQVIDAGQVPSCL